MRGTDSKILLMMWLMSLRLLLMLTGTVISNHGNGSLRHTLTCRLLSCLSSLQLSYSPEVRPAVIMQLGLSSRGQLQVTHRTKGVAPTLTWKKNPRMNSTKEFSPKLILKWVRYLGKKSFGRRACERCLCSVFLDTFLQRQWSAHSPGAERGWEESSSLRGNSRNGF